MVLANPTSILYVLYGYLPILGSAPLIVAHSMNTRRQILERKGDFHRMCRLESEEGVVEKPHAAILAASHERTSRTNLCRLKFE
jgi:hypothetical protein